MKKYIIYILHLFTQLFIVLCQFINVHIRNLILVRKESFNF